MTTHIWVHGAGRKQVALERQVQSSMVWQIAHLDLVFI